MTTEHTISVAWRDRPFDGQFHRQEIAFEGRPPTIKAILSRVEGLPELFRHIGEVRLNGQIVPSEWWDRVRPREDMPMAITLHMPLKSGGGSSGGGSTQNKSKSTVATVATIGVLLAATAISAGALGPAALGVLGAGYGTGIGAAALGAGVGIGGDLYTGTTL